MKKKIVVALLSASLLLSSCGNQPASSATPSDSESSAASESTVTEPTAESTDDLSELDALGSVEVDEGLFTVEITIPADYVGDSTQEDLDARCKEYGYKSITLNDDGSATYVMTKKQHQELLDEMRADINESLAEMVESETYPNFTKVEANDNFTEFTITTKSTTLDLSESFSVLGFYMYGGIYSIYSGEEVDNISVTFINADTGEIISSSNSSDENN